MRKFIIAMVLLVLSICSAELTAQSEPTLERAVRDQYVESIDEKDLTEITETESLTALDPYSHFLTEEELADVRDDPKAAAFVLPLDEQTLYLRIPVFHAKTSQQVHDALTILKGRSDIRGIIIDLRGNRGGLLNAAIEVADQFIATGVLATTTGRLDTANLVFLAGPDGLLESVRVAVLIDKNTASASELLAGILKLNAKACLIGQNSFGKSAVQTQIILNNGDALSLTTANYYFSNGKTVSGKGITPDYPISTRQLRRYPPFTRAQNPMVGLLQNMVLQKALQCFEAK